MTTALLETLALTEITLAQHSQLIGAVLEGQEGASATVKVNGVAVTYPVTLTESDTLRIERPVGEVVTRLYGQPGPNAGTGPKGEPGTAATVTVGTVTTGAAGTQAQVTNSGTTSAAVLNFTIPKGADGAGGSGAVSSVAGRTGDVTLTKADVGLGDVTNDAQVKRSEMGAASGVATLGADGKVPAAQLPAGTGGGGSLPAGGLSGQVLTKNSATDGDASWKDAAAGGGLVSLRHVGTANLAPTGRPITGDSLGWMGPKLPAATIERRYAAVRVPLINAAASAKTGDILRMRWVDANGVVRFAPADISIMPGMTEARWAGPFVVPPGTSNAVLVAFWSPSAGSYNPDQMLYGSTTGGGSYQYSSSSVLASMGVGEKFANFIASDRQRIILLDGEATQKGTTNSLDPVDFPVSTTAAAPNKSGFMVVDDAAKTASLYWKFSDGTTKKLDLT